MSFVIQYGEIRIESDSAQAILRMADVLARVEAKQRRKQRKEERERAHADAATGAMGD